MKTLNINYLNAVSGGIASWSNGVITVTDESTFQMNGLKILANSATDLYTNTSLYDGTQNSFCFNGEQYNITSVTGGHRYITSGSC